MTMFLNYEESHTEVFARGDEGAKAIIERVNSFMISEKMRDVSLRPRFPFNMCFFYQSLVQIVGMYLGKEYRSGLRKSEMIHAVDIPDLTFIDWQHYDFVKLNLAEAYIDEVRRCSIACDNDFDVSFACLVACESIDSEWLTLFRNRRWNSNNDDFDKWLAGFNNY